MSWRGATRKRIFSPIYMNVFLLLLPSSIHLVSSKSFNEVDGVARLVDPSKREAKLGVVFPGNRFSRPVPADGNYWVLSTDYVNYSVVWSCETFNGKSFRKSPATRQL